MHGVAIPMSKIWKRREGAGIGKDLVPGKPIQWRGRSNGMARTNPPRTPPERGRPTSAPLPETPPGWWRRRHTEPTASAWQESHGHSRLGKSGIHAVAYRPSEAGSRSSSRRAQTRQPKEPPTIAPRRRWTWGKTSQGSSRPSPL